MCWSWRLLKYNPNIIYIWEARYLVNQEEIKWRENQSSAKFIKLNEQREMYIKISKSIRKKKLISCNNLNVINPSKKRPRDRESVEKNYFQA